MASITSYTKAALDTLLAAKAALSHTHAQADVTGLSTSLSGKAPTVHTHAQADVTNLTTDLASKVADTGDTMTGDLVINNAKLKAGTTTDVLGSALEVIRNNLVVGRIDNNSNGLRVQAQSGTLQLRGTGNTGISIDSAGVADFVSNPTVGGTALAEIIRDTMGAALVQGSGVTITVNDAGDTITIAASGGGVPLPVLSTTPTWRSAFGATDVTTGGGWTAQRLSLYAIPLDQAASLTGLGIVVTTAGGGSTTAYAVVYADDGNYNPGALVKASSALSVVTTGLKTDNGFSAVSMPAGLYWIGILNVDSTAVQYRTTGLDMRTLWLRSSHGTGTTENEADNNPGYVWERTSAGATPPANASSGGGGHVGNHNSPAQPVHVYLKLNR